MTKPSEEVHRVAPQRNDVLAVLRKMKPILQEKYGVTQLGIFGSVARDEATDRSDVDIVFDIEKPHLFTFVHIKDDLEAELNVPVDLIHYRARMNTYLKARIEREAMYV
ncbi:MAG: nucleotidyltransferase family protein [Phormidesmis sp.]